MCKSFRGFFFFLPIVSLCPQYIIKVYNQLYSLSLESKNLNVNHLEVTYGQQLSIMMMSVTEKLEFTPVNKQQPNIIWSRNVKAIKGEVISSGEEKRFIIKSVTFDDQGNYTEWNLWANVASVHVVKVLCKFLFLHTFLVVFLLSPSHILCFTFSMQSFLDYNLLLN